MITDDLDQLLDEPPNTETGRDETLAEILGICDEFLHHTNTTVHNELRDFLARQGYHSVTGLGWFLDVLQFTAHDLRHHHS